MLSLTQSRELNRGNRLQTYLTNNIAVYQSYLPFKNHADTFKGYITGFATLAKAKEASGTHETRTKAALKTAVADKMEYLFNLAHAYAVDMNDTALKLKTDITRSDVILQKDTDLLAYVAAHLAVFTPELLADKVFITYDITAAQIADALADATAFDAKIGNAGVIESGADNANDQMNELIKQMRASIAQMERLLPRFKQQHPAFVTGFNQNAVLENTGVRHSGVQGTVSIGGTAVAGAVVTVVGTKKTATTDAQGHYSILSIKAGDYEIQAIATGHEALVKKQHISQGHIDTLDFEW